MVPRADGKRIVSGKCFVCKDNIDTDQIIPAEVNPQRANTTRDLQGLLWASSVARQTCEAHLSPQAILPPGNRYCFGVFGAIVSGTVIAERQRAKERPHSLPYASSQYLTLVPSKPDEYEKLGSYAMIGLPDDLYPTRESARATISPGTT